MTALIVVLLIIIVFVASCDAKWVDSLKNIMKKNCDVEDVYGATEGFLGDRTPPSDLINDTPEFSKSMRSSDASYVENITATVDQSIVDSHNEYIADSDFLATTGASHRSDNSHFTPAVPYHGPMRRAMYAHPGADSDSRITTSETTDQIADNQYRSANALF